MQALLSGRVPAGLRHALLRRLVLALAVAVWEVAARAHGSVYFPPPGRIARHAYDLWFSGSVRHMFRSEAAVADILPGLVRMGAGFGLAAVAGIALGVAVGRSWRAYALCNPVLQFARAVPPPALVPVFVVVLGFGTPMQIASIAFSAVWPVLINTAEGARNTDPLRLDVAAVLRLNPVERLCFLILPSALPRIFAGLRLSLSLSLILMVFSDCSPAPPTASASPSPTPRPAPTCSPYGRPWSCSAPSAICSTPACWRSRNASSAAEGRPHDPYRATPRPPGQVTSAHAPPRRGRPVLRRPPGPHRPHPHCARRPTPVRGRPVRLRQVHPPARRRRTAARPRGHGHRRRHPRHRRTRPARGRLPGLRPLPLPWLTVRDNVALPLRRRGLGRAERRAEAARILERVGLDGAAGRHPWQLSGGMQQRVAIARALVCRPSLLLMDEPFGSLDAQTREDLEDLLREVHRTDGTTIVFVTHDIDESVYVGDRVVVLSPGPGSHIVLDLPVELPGKREQIGIRGLPEFVALRAEVGRAVRGT